MIMNSDKKRGSMDPIKLMRAVLPLAVILAVFAALVIFYGDKLIEIVASPSVIKAELESFGHMGGVIFVLFQILQIVIAVIPGEPIQLAGGFVFGTLGGFALSTIGIMAGSFIAFAISRKFGVPVVRLFVSEEKLIEYKGIIESKKGLGIMFLLFLVPAIPKDVLIYAAGLTPIKFKVLFIIYFFARIPANLAASYMGAQLGNENYVEFVLAGIAAAVILGAFYMFRDRIMAMFERI
jgi:uncharacterized membrane protein YdjX (TVP38/TMEM64 family)